MIHVIAGYMGAGKSLFAVRWLYRHRKRYRVILTNSPLQFYPAEYSVNFQRDLEYWTKKEEGKIAVFLDEAHLVLDSRRSSSRNNVTWTHLLTLLRKLDIDLILTTQSLMQVDIRLRSLLRTAWVAEGKQLLETQDGSIAPFYVYNQYAVRMQPLSGKYIFIPLNTVFVSEAEARQYYDLYDTNWIPPLLPEEESTIDPDFNPINLVGEYAYASDIIELLQEAGYKANTQNYRQILKQLGLNLITRKSNGKRRWIITQGKGKVAI